MNTYKGAIHIHSSLSDGSGDIQSITVAAKQAGLKWLVITDHNNFDIEEGIINGVCVIKGEEISPKNENHYLALGINKVIMPDNADEYVQEVKEQGGFGFIAHPDEREERPNKNKPIKWLADDSNADGIEIWNWFSQWADNYNDKNIFTIIHSFFSAHRKIKKPYKETLARWDRLNNESNHIIPAIAGIDAHALKISKYIIPVTVFPYKKMFKTLSNVILTEDSLKGAFEQQKQTILTALKNGNNIIINRCVFDKIPYIEISNKVKKVISGEQIELDEKTYLNIKLTQKAEIKIILDGIIICELKAKKCSYKVLKAGKYRVELLIKDRGWAYSNPIEVYEVKSFE